MEPTFTATPNEKKAQPRLAKASFTFTLSFIFIFQPLPTPASGWLQHLVRRLLCLGGYALDERRLLACIGDTVIWVRGG
jgi:hypothetical protein